MQKEVSTKMVLSKMAYREDVTEYSRLPWLLSGKEPVCQCRRHKPKALGQEDPLEEGIAIHSSILAWKILWTEKPSGLRPSSHKELDTTDVSMHTRNYITL